MRFNPVSCRGCFHAERESQSHSKQSWQGGQEYIHSRKTLVWYWNLNPGKGSPPAVFFIAPNGAVARPARCCEHTSLSSRSSLSFSAPARARSRSICRAFAGSESGPCRGLGAAPNKRFEQFSHSGKWANAQRCVPLCPACHN